MKSGGAGAGLLGSGQRQRSRRWPQGMWPWSLIVFRLVFSSRWARKLCARVPGGGSP
jgi:hypothetical protein